MVNNDPKPVGSGASVLILRIQALINVRNFILIAFIVFFAATTLFLPKYRTYDTSGAIIVGMPPSEISKVQKAYELKFSELHQRFQVMQIEYSEEAAKWKQQIDHERSVYLQNVEALQERLAEEQKVRQAELERFQSVLSHRDTKIKAQEEEFRIISEKIVELQHRRDELYEFAAEAQRNQELVMQRIVEESKLSCEQLSSNTMKECEDHIAVIEKENKVLRSDLEAALEANTEMHASSEHTIVQLESQLNITIDHCNSQLLSQRQLYESRCSDEYLRERIGAVLNDRVRCPTPTPHDCDSICKVKVENKAIEVERSCRGNDPETELYRYDVDYALYSSGTKVMQNLTAPTYFPPSLHLSSIIKNRLRSVGLDEYQDFIPDFSGENVLNGVGLQLHRGLPIDALTTDLSLGSCWPMKVKLLHLW